MIYSLIALKATIAFGAGSLAMLLSQRTSAAFRHALCALTVFAAVLSPAVLLFPAPAAAPLIRISTTALVSPGPQSTGSVDLLALLWSAGAVAVLFRFAAGIAYLFWRTRKAVPAPGVQNLLLADVSTPLVWGWFRPTILMPYGWLDWDGEQRRLALAHEQAHVRRGDLWMSLLMTVAEAVFWWHPLAWYVLRRMRTEQELACDEAVLADEHNGTAYARLLLASAAENGTGLLFGCGMTGLRKGELRMRVEKAVRFKPCEYRRGASTWAVVFGMAVILTAGLAIAPAMGETPYKIGGDVSAPTLSHKQEPEYTDAAKKAKISGVVLLNIVVDQHGKPRNIHVLKSLEPGLDLQAVKAVSKWRFVPGKRNGKPVAVKANVEVNFRLL